ncbi:hypothetical protein G6O69_07215 [Pseudenhygromyxa sp. WMMC2535]|uniref:hypothetical protein n=1 Tax=Pseudenhygromyxa sp. WMMC2535 TaxID=2712867 RepID=UPI001554E21A|nr:hypothetical protein [Pseudenhygromyxa sp. WMMC2535]NVB37616.1 hypothetical protein [Pseudenhygromyxa sp. WMMC2535]
MRPPISLLASALALATSLCAVGCDKGGAGAQPEETWRLGHSEGSSPDIQGGEALEDGDVDGAAARGVALWKMQRAMRMGDRGFAAAVGVTSAKFVALAALDRAGSSGEVAYFRWDEDPASLERWIVVSVTFDPDEAMEPQKFDDRPNGEQRRTLAALWTAEAKAQADYPDARWVAYSFRERDEKSGRLQTRLYFIGSDDQSPDLEYRVLDPVKAKKRPEIVDHRLHLEAGVWAKLPLVTPLTPPGPPTFARAVAIATATGKPVEVIDGVGAHYEVEPDSGLVTRK